jgi:hypothetical protein
VLDGFDYASFKLFHLSVLFRAHVSRSCPFADLGPHAEIIRQMILNRDPGPAWRYPVICKAIEFEGAPMDEFVAIGLPVRLDGTRGFMSVFLGVEWLCFVCSHRTTKIERLALRDDGSLPIAIMPPQFHTFIKTN